MHVWFSANSHKRIEINFDTLNVFPLVIVHFFLGREHFNLDLYLFFVWKYQPVAKQVNNTERIRKMY